MILPKPNIPYYFTELISTNGKKVKYRPYLVKEQEIILAAVESRNKLSIVDACINLINSCVEGVDAKTLPVFDFEYLFLKLRTASSGSEIILNVPCSNEECKEVNQVKISIDFIEIKSVEGHTNKIDFEGGVGVVLTYPTIEDIFFKSEKEIILSCIESIYNEEASYSRTDFSPEDLLEWFGSLSNSDLNKIKLFFETLPKIRLEFNFRCTKCKEVTTKVIEGFQNFFIYP